MKNLNALLLFPLLCFISSCSHFGLDQNTEAQRNIASLTSQEQAIIKQLELIAVDKNISAQFINELKEELQPQIATLHREVKTYHYGQRGENDGSHYRISLDAPREVANSTVKYKSSYHTPLELEPAEAVEYFKRKSGLLFKDGTPEGVAGPGLYAAVDPVQSETYIGNPGFLMEISVPKGTRYLKSVGGFSVSENFYNKWIKTELAVKHSEDEVAFLSGSTRDYMAFKTGNGRYFISQAIFLNFPKIRELLVTAIRDLKIDFLLYSWAKYTSPFCAYHNANHDFDITLALNFINPEILNRGAKLLTFVPSLEGKENLAPEKAKQYTTLLDKIESSYLMIQVQIANDGRGYGTGAKPVPDYIYNFLASENTACNNPAFLKDTFGNSLVLDVQGKMIFRSNHWNKSLNRRSMLKDIFVDQAALSLIDACGYEAAYLAEPKGMTNDFILTLNREAIKGHLDETTANGKSAFKYFYYVDPRVVLKRALGDERFKALEARIVNETFGCGPNHADEAAKYPFDFN